MNHLVQNIIAALIIGLSASYVLWKIYKFFKSPEEMACSPEKCKSCAHKSEICNQEEKN